MSNWCRCRIRVEHMLPRRADGRNVLRCNGRGKEQTPHKGGLKHWIWTKISPAGMARRGPRYAAPGPPRPRICVIYLVVPPENNTELTQWGLKPWMRIKICPTGLARRGRHRHTTPGPPRPKMSDSSVSGWRKRPRNKRERQLTPAMFDTRAKSRLAKMAQNGLC